MGEPVPGTSTPDAGTENRLDSWKEIAAYLERDVTTVQRWEKREGMPVHRHLHDKRGSVYAIPAELDAWRESRRLRLGAEAEPEAQATERGTQAPPAMAQPAEPPANASGVRFWLALAGVAIVAILAIAYAISRGRTGGAASPKIQVDCGVAPQEYVGRSRPGISCRWDDGRADRPALRHSRLARHFSHFRDAIQESAGSRARNCEGAAR